MFGHGYGKRNRCRADADHGQQCDICDANRYARNTVTGGTWSSSNTGVVAVNPEPGHNRHIGRDGYYFLQRDFRLRRGGCFGYGVCCFAASTDYGDNVCVLRRNDYAERYRNRRGGNSSNTSIASVNGSGVVTGIATGTATITYIATNISGAFTVTATVTSIRRRISPLISLWPARCRALILRSGMFPCF